LQQVFAWDLAAQLVILICKKDPIVKACSTSNKFVSTGNKSVLTGNKIDFTGDKSNSTGNKSNIV